MRNFILWSSFLLVLFAANFAFATCKDIKDRCWENYRQDKKACGTGFDDATMRCLKRAEDRKDYCLKQANC